jgi:SWI/SNF-related matrix-associated actin-dependent regulator of chromatin subfamily A member 5
VTIFLSDKKEMLRLKKEVLPFLASLYDVVVTTYEMAKNPELQHMLSHNLTWRCVVLDEGHIIRNEGSLIARAVRRMHYQQVRGVLLEVARDRWV